MVAGCRRTGVPGSLVVVAAAALGLVASCGSGGGGSVPMIDAGVPPDARRAIDATPEPDRIDPLLWVQFSAVGCQRGGADQEPCEGSAPLTATFTAAAPAAIDTYLWDFGDGTETVTEPRPTHVFDEPGTYDVSLTVGGPGGTASSLRVAFAVVTPAPVGAPCSAAIQCAEGLSCLCSEGVECPTALSAGICSVDCSATGDCPEGSTCVDLASGVAREPWQGRFCLAACDEAGVECRDGFACQTLRDGVPEPSGEPGEPDESPWIAACFAPGLLAPNGSSCFDAASNPVDDACAGGICEPVGARGLCTSGCDSSADCPGEAVCATFNAGQSRCLLPCLSPQGDCEGDPWLACAPPGAPGALGFSVAEDPPSNDGYCAPKPCAEPGECPDGACVDGHCGPAE